MRGGCIRRLALSRLSKIALSNRKEVSFLYLSNFAFLFNIKLPENFNKESVDVQDDSERFDDRKTFFTLYWCNVAPHH